MRYTCDMCHKPTEKVRVPVFTSEDGFPELTSLPEAALLVRCYAEPDSSIGLQLCRGCTRKVLDFIIKERRQCQA